MRWLKEEARGPQVVWLMLGFLILGITYNFIGALITELCHITVPERASLGIQIFTPLFPFILIYAAIMEELIFRLPLAIPIELGWSTKKVLLVALALSIAFGWSHGGLFFILFQGVSGLLWSILFLKCGGLHKNYLKAVTTTLIAHISYNVTVIGLAVIFEGITSI